MKLRIINERLNANCLFWLGILKVDFCAAGWPSGYRKTLDTCLECEAEIVQTDQEEIEDTLIHTAVDTSRAGVVYLKQFKVGKGMLYESGGRIRKTGLRL
jgi:hypothetical protein